MSTQSPWRRWIIGEWSWGRPIKSAGFVYGSLFIVAVFFADRLIFIPPPSSYDENHPALKLLTDPEKDDDQKIATFWYPPPTDEAPVLLWTHGNAEDIGNVAPLLQIFAEQGVGILAVDYPGYGLSDGRPNEVECYRVIDTAFRHLVEDLNIAKERIVLVGQSVGGGPAVWLAERQPEIRGLALISPFLSAFRVATKIPLFPRDRFPNLKRMPKVSCPLLVFHGERDEVIPFSHGQKLFTLHPGPKKAFVPLPDAGHNNLWSMHFDDVLSGLMDFAILRQLPNPESP